MNRYYKSAFLIFTDLDGTLLDHYTYSFSAALPALRETRRQGLPLIICTSKTTAETEAHRRRLRNNHPFIVENGGAVVIPKNYFPFLPPRSIKKGGYRVIPFGSPHRLVLKALQQVSKATGIALTGISTMTIEEIRRRTGLGRTQASRARIREYNEPFIIADERPRTIRLLEEAVRARGMTLIRGGRFWHLTGGGDKGLAVKTLTSLYRRVHRQVRTLGIGDSRNDFPMLRQVDFPYLVCKPNGRYEKDSRKQGFPKAGGIGPIGWNRAVLKFLKNYNHS